jgi:S-formylglutathione hydrolase FrmB
VTTDSYTDGNHNFNYWSTAVPAAFDFLAATLNAA